MYAKIVRLSDWKYFGLALLFVLIPLFSAGAQDERHEILSLAWKPDGSQFAAGYINSVGIIFENSRHIRNVKAAGYDDSFSFFNERLHFFKSGLR